MTLRQIECFLRLANNLSFARTAEELFTTQPTVSREIQAIETEMGVQLFKRTRRSVELTPAGAMLRQDLQAPYNGIQNAILKARNVQTRFQSRLRIGFCNTASVQRLPAAIRTYKAEYPDVQIQVFSRSLSSLNELFASGQLDIVFGMKSALFPGEGDGFRLLYRGVLCAVVPADHELAGESLLTPEKLGSHTLLVQESSGIPTLMGQFYAAIRNRCPDCRFLYSSSINEIEMLLLSGIGITITPQYSLPPSEHYRMIPFEAATSVNTDEIDYYSMWHRDRNHHNAETFVAKITQLYMGETS